MKAYALFRGQSEPGFAVGFHTAAAAVDGFHNAAGTSGNRQSSLDTWGASGKQKKAPEPLRL